MANYKRGKSSEITPINPKKEIQRSSESLQPTERSQTPDKELVQTSEQLYEWSHAKKKGKWRNTGVKGGW